MEYRLQINFSPNEKTNIVAQYWSNTEKRAHRHQTIGLSLVGLACDYLSMLWLKLIHVSKRHSRRIYMKSTIRKYLHFLGGEGGLQSDSLAMHSVTCKPVVLSDGIQMDPCWYLFLYFSHANNLVWILWTNVHVPLLGVPNHLARQQSWGKYQVNSCYQFQGWG